jgi:hypothetical protein
VPYVVLLCEKCEKVADQYQEYLPVTKSIYSNLKSKIMERKRKRKRKVRWISNFYYYWDDV